MCTYKQLLERVWDSVPEKTMSKKRFKIPPADSFIEGKQTIVRNFLDIAKELRRDSKHLMRYLSKELAAPVTISGSRLVVQRVLKTQMVDERIKRYADEYVICHECHAPDTKTTELGGEKIIKCEACGAWRPFRKV